MHLIQHRFGIYCKNQFVHIDSGSWSSKQTFCLEGRKERESLIFFSPGKISLRSQAVCRALVQSVVTLQRTEVPVGS